MTENGQDKKSIPWAEKEIKVSMDKVLSERLDIVATHKGKTPESVMRRALSKYLKRFNRTFKIW